MSHTILQDGVPVEISDADYAAQFPVQPLPPVPVSGSAILGSLSDAQVKQCALKDVVRLAVDPDVPVTNSKLKRMAAALGITPDALRASGAAQ